jgi:hypothetical protein
MGIQINGQTDTISAVDGALIVSGADLPTVTNLNATGIVTALSLNVGIGGTILTTISDRGIGIGTNSYASPIQARFAVSNSSETFEFSPGWDTYNGGVIEYLNRSSNTTRPDLNFYTTASGNGSIKFWTGGSERFRITGIGGSVGIGTTNPSAKFQVSETSFPSAVFAPSISTVNSDKVGAAKSFYVYIDREPTSTIWSDTSNRDRFFNNSLYVRTPVKDGVNNPAIVIAENSGQASGRNSLVFWNSDYNNGDGYIKSRIYTDVGNNYNSTSFYIDVADSNRAIQNRLKIDVAGRVSKPYQPHIFGSVTNTSTQTNSLANSMNVRTSTELTFSNSRITVPISGLYLITFTTLSTNGSTTGRYDSNIFVNGTAYVSALNEDNGTGYHFKSMSATIKLSANDYIQFYNQNWYDYTGTGYSEWRTASVTFLG